MRQPPGCEAAACPYDVGQSVGEGGGGAPVPVPTCSPTNLVSKSPLGQVDKASSLGRVSGIDSDE